ncbi:MAG: DUF4292 domain-containing protein [Cytophagales bacterium]|nr:DUF4292 domain-containing protein [Cytophagales bacterium]
MNKVVYGLIFASLLFTSCKREFALFNGASGKFAVNEFQFDYLSSKAKFKYTSGKSKLSATASFRIKKDSLIWVSISPGLGIEAARVLISRDKIQMIDKLKKDYYELDYVTLTETYGFEMNYDLAESIVLGNMLFMPEKRRDISLDDKQYSFTKIDGPYGVSHFVGVNSQKLEKLFAFDQVTNNSISVNYGSFEKVEGQVAPQLIDAKIKIANEKKEDTHIEIEYNRTELSNKPLKMPFHVSSRYKRK